MAINNQQKNWIFLTVGNRAERSKYKKVRTDIRDPKCFPVELTTGAGCSHDPVANVLNSDIIAYKFEW